MKNINENTKISNEAKQELKQDGKKTEVPGSKEDERKTAPKKLEKEENKSGNGENWEASKRENSRVGNSWDDMRNKDEEEEEEIY
eukprot:CAMPEP_0205806346 /NCGR_PEP_ID=MMETSP0205-20121125/9882_1 /ASSEMBLY_ACC=CAM_ASM_000278 /TAXON_ID=36767 /ORGANISM="Euplotes focardii, Strain TN1" /LENGTH=84 /DNA_ID=CAMNT_0053079097 /DNA_START=469 /DNA_END=724 /DNA_ORIENTATION=-